MVAAHGALMGDGGAQWRRFMSRGNGESSLAGRRSSQCAYGGWPPPNGVRSQARVDGEASSAGGRSSRCAYGGWQSLMAQAYGLGGGKSSSDGGRSSRCACGGWQPSMARCHRLGGREVQPGWSLQLAVRLWGMVAPNGAGSHARGTGSVAQLVIAAHGVPVADGNPQWRGLTGRGDGECNPTGGCSSWHTCWGWQPPMVQAHRLGGRGV